MTGVQTCALPISKTRKSLYIFLHEVAHAVLHADGRRKPRYIEEYEAEMFAHTKMHEHGLSVPADMTARAKKYVARKIEQARKRGLKAAVDPQIEEFARPKEEMS